MLLAATFGALLAEPELQANNHRLEVLVHLAFLSGAGTRKPDDRIVALGFNAMSDSWVGQQEDPSEDVFVYNLATRQGNLRVLGGTWESGGFHLQRLINTLDSLGDGGLLAALRKSTYGLLRLSDEICRRGKLARNQFGREMPLAELPSSISEGLGSLHRIVRFTIPQLTSLGISLEDLAPFGFTPNDRAALRSERVGHSGLERYPLVMRGDNVFVCLPSAVVPAITRFLVEEMSGAGARRAFAAAVANEYSTLLSRTPLLGTRGRLAVELRGTDGGFMAGAMTEIDRGLYLNLIFFSDDLEDFGTNGMLGSFPVPGKLGAVIDKWIDDSHKAARERSEFTGGLTLVVPCGVGRGVPFFIQDKAREGWRVEFISAPDLISLSWLPQFESLSLWRMLDARERLAELGVELQNINGLLNLVGWIRQLGGHIVPHADMPDDIETMSLIMMVQQNSLRTVRSEALTRWDLHVAQDLAGKWRRVLRDENSLFEEDHRQPFYVSDEPHGKGWPEAVYESPTRRWWCTLATSQGTSGHFAYERFRLLKTWIIRFAPVLDHALLALPSTVVWNVVFQGDIADRPAELGMARSNYEQALAAIAFEIDHKTGSVRLVAEASLERAFLHQDNIAERALVQRTVEGFRELAGLSTDPEEVERLVALIVPDGNARSQHAFMAQDFRDWVRNSLWAAPIKINGDDAALIKLGLGWNFRERAEGSEIAGKAECTAFLNRVVRGLEDEICTELRQFNCGAVIDFAVLNHESACGDRDQWHDTAAAVIALHNDKQAALDVMMQKDFEISAVLQTSRLLVEFALGESRAEGGRVPGHLQMSRLMAKLMLVLHLGGWSDAIRWDAMEPRLRVTPLGDIHANLSFHEEVITPFGRTTSRQRIHESIAHYAENVDDPPTEDNPLPPVEEFPPVFWEAWTEEFGASVEALRQLMRTLDNHGIETQQAMFRMSKSELLAALQRKAPLGAEAVTLIERLIFTPRASWRESPPGYDAKDIFPWRFRRRLSVLRRPLIQINNEADPQLVIAPGLVEDAVRYMLGNYHRGDFPLWQLSPKMRQWAGHSSNRRGHAFSFSVAARMKELGWETRSEVLVTALLGKGFPIDYGDIDVVAWRPDTGRVLVIECKDMQFRKTDGEIAEQLADFRGLEVNGRRDLLRKHLDRLDLVNAHIPELKKALRLGVEPRLEGELVFKNAVPMQFAWEQLRSRTALHVFDDLDQI
ncbi:hypothetical protein [Mesorhizobium sp. M0185]|uniref:hypothetical protein n=1 Tax=Mesorhizobium sp. M0185 TaxID=2956907 RepID=UPI00333C8008